MSGEHTGGRTGLPIPGYPDSLRASLPSHLPSSCPSRLPNCVLFASSSLFARYWCESWMRRADGAGAACPPQPSPTLHFLHLFLSYPPTVSFRVHPHICSLVLFIAVTPVWCRGQGLSCGPQGGHSVVPESSWCLYVVLSCALRTVPGMK